MGRGRTPGGQRSLEGNKVSRRRSSRPSLPPQGDQSLVTLPIGRGITLNLPESMIYRVLQDLHIRFEAQALIGTGKALGGGMVDFWLFDYHLDLDYLGPFHFSAEGAARDFWRDVTRAQFGILRVFLYEHDLPHLHRRIQEIIGAPVVEHIMTQGFRSY